MAMADRSVAVSGWTATSATRVPTLCPFRPTTSWTRFGRRRNGSRRPPTTPASTHRGRPSGPVARESVPTRFHAMPGSPFGHPAFRRSLAPTDTSRPATTAAPGRWCGTRPAFSAEHRTAHEVRPRTAHDVRPRLRDHLDRSSPARTSRGPPASLGGACSPIGTSGWCEARALITGDHPRLLCSLHAGDHGQVAGGRRRAAGQAVGTADGPMTGKSRCRRPRCSDASEIVHGLQGR
ncbi:hypothetical protein SAMN06272781_1695 [Streptomyces sp. 1222.2]|nr:hypothetical protein SAMN06272781_1695 [Streptomyces sp. 1222.2]